LDVSISDVQLIKSPKNIKGKNPIWVNYGDRTVKYYKCSDYEFCLNLGYKNDMPNWSCLYCNHAKQATINDLVVFRVKKSFSKTELEIIRDFEKTHGIKIRESKNNR